MPQRITKSGPYRLTYIRAWREFRQLSQDRLVERVREYVDSFSKASLSRIERGLQPYTQETLEALAVALQCEPADLIMRDPTNSVWSIMDTLKNLPEEQQHQIEEIVKTFRAA